MYVMEEGKSRRQHCVHHGDAILGCPSKPRCTRGKDDYNSSSQVPEGVRTGSAWKL